MIDDQNFKERLINALKNIKNALIKPNNEAESKGKFAFNVLFQVGKSLIYLLVVVLLLGGFFAAGIGAGYFAYLVSDTEIPSRNELREKINDVELISNFTYSNGEKVADIRSDLIRTNVNSEDINPIIKEALISTEDEYFNIHKGIVPKAVIRALISDAVGIGGKSGGSTITQQLVKQQVLTSETTFKRKANEIVLALRVEKFFSKDEIITAYLNVSPFGRNNKGQNIAGVEEAAKGIFGVNAKDLSLPQAAFIAGLPQSPIVYSPYTNTGELKPDQQFGLQRKDQVLYNMYKEEVITKQEYEEAKAVDIQQQFRPTQGLEGSQNDFLYYTIQEQAIQALMPTFYKQDGVTKEDLEKNKNLYDKYYKVTERELRRNGYTVTSTIDKNIYNSMQQAAIDYGGYLETGGTMIDAGSILMENQTGKILGFLGGRNYNVSQNNHAFQTRRSPGSTMKPILTYAPAIDVGLIGSESKLANFARTYKSEPTKQITNYGKTVGNNFVSVRDALKNSDNIPVINLNDRLVQVTQPENYFKKMNIQMSDHEFKYDSIPLGATDVGLTVYEQTNAYATLANKGKYKEGYAIEKITDKNGEVVYQHEDKSVDVYSPATASIMNDLMRDVLNSGTGKIAKDTLSSFNPPLASADWVGKTGTSEDDKDFWFTASTPTVTLSSWIGNDQGVPMPSSYGNNNMQFWAALANYTYQQNPALFAVDQKFTIEPTVMKAKVSDFTGQKPGIAYINTGRRQVPGKEIISLYAAIGPSDSQFNFAIGGTDEQFKSAWGSAPSTQSPSKKKEDKDKKKDDKSEDNSKPDNSSDENDDDDGSSDD